MSVDIRVYGIVDPQVARGRPLAELAREAVRGGATLLQYRAKTATTRQMVRDAQAIREALDGSGVPLLINDRVDVALAAGAAGVHLGADDMDLADARRLLGDGAIIGATLGEAAELAYLASARIDYACIGPFSSTLHKDDADRPLGPAGYASLRQAARERLGVTPVGAIGGITPANTADVIGAGADGVAVIGAMFATDDVSAATARLREAVEQALAAR